MSMGTIAFLMSKVEKKISEFTNGTLDNLVTSENINYGDEFIKPKASDNLAAWLWFAGMSGLYGLIASALTTYWAPGATGSGVAELIGYLNGINYPGWLEIKTLVTKIIGVTFAVCARLAVGKEGPLAHIGAIMGALVLYIPGLGFEFLRNDTDKRIFIAAGASVGVSCAFGAPMGGSLFAYEMSKTTTFWKFDMIWKTFAACALGNFVFSLWNYFTSDDPTPSFNTSTLKFGIQTVEVNQYPAGILILGAIWFGIICGLLGPLFLMINQSCNTIRAKILDAPWKKVLETTFFAFMSASILFWTPFFFKLGKCHLNNSKTEEEEYYSGWCPKESTYSPGSTLFWSGEGEIIRIILNSHFVLTRDQMILFGCVWYFLMCVTYGTMVPSGLFLPGMIVGCVLGDLFARETATLFDGPFADFNSKDLTDSKNSFEALDLYNGMKMDFVTLACAGMLASYTRMTYSLVVIMMETTQSLYLFVPLLITIFLSNVVAE